MKEIQKPAKWLLHINQMKKNNYIKIQEKVWDILIL